MNGTLITLGERAGTTSFWWRIAVSLLFLSTICMSQVRAGVIYLDEDFEGDTIFVDRGWSATGDTEPTSVTIKEGINLRCWEKKAPYNDKGVYLEPADGSVVSDRAYKGLKSYKLTDGKGLGVKQGEFSFRNGTGSRCWQFALSTDAASVGKPAGTVLGDFAINYNSASAASLTPDTSITLQLRAVGGGKADLVCLQNGAKLGTLSGAADDWLLVTGIAMNRINKGTNTDTFSHWVTYDPDLKEYKGPQAGIGTGVHFFVVNSKSGERARTVLKRGAGLPSTWGNGDATNTSEINWRFFSSAEGTLYVDNLYWDSRNHEAANGGFDHDRGMRVEQFPVWLTLSFLFTDNAVLQRQKPVPVWGISTPGDTVTVKFRNQVKQATADSHGNWRATLDPMDAGGPDTLTVTGGESSVTLQNIMVGDVWVCSGQSNMAFTLGDSANAASETLGANYPNIRLISLQTAGAKNPMDYQAGNWQVCTPQSAANFSAVGYFFGRDIFTSLNSSVPIGLINTSYGGTRAETWTSLPALQASGIDSKYLIPSWLSIGNGELFNGMVKPLIAFPISGVNWYQGESNADTSEVYEPLMRTLIEDWRAQWGLGDFLFQLVQISSYDTGPDGDPWMGIREAQLQTSLKVPNTALAVTIDYGDAADIHPKRKKPVGHRLALSALAKHYGQNVAYSGPLLQQITTENDGWLRLDFRCAEGGLVDATGGALLGFEVAGDDGQFTTATATIAGEAVRVRSALVPAPRYVRYAWANVPPAELYNKEMLPASPFKGDRLNRDSQAAVGGEWIIYR